ncbi:MAG: mannanase [Chloroflexi bacterium]|nr:mannanase [Chloroflexota bacterium]
MNISRITLTVVGGIAALLVGLILALPGGSVQSAIPEAPAAVSPDVITSGFVTVSDGQFTLDGEPYRFVGVNFWQGMNLAVDDRKQLVKELDQLQALGITNLRVMASSEGPDTEPYRMTPALMIAPGEYNETVLDGLDYFMAQVGAHDMRAVMVLNNYWQWSGGMAQYVSWAEESAIPYPGDWGQFMSYSGRFYDCDACQTWYRDHIEMIINHTNPYTGLAYRDDPAVFSWELANEPRRYPQTWIDDTAATIKSLDPNHMVTTGSEGTPPGERISFEQTHAGPDIDYTTIHIWPQNWGWYDPKNANSYAHAETLARLYFQEHADIAAELNKPLVLEEFGLTRDWEPLHDTFDPESPVTTRDQFYAALFEEVLISMQTDGPAAGDNFWAWAGEARPGNGWVGDPPHETPGWYSVYDSDESTLAIITAHAQAITALQE